MISLRKTIFALDKIALDRLDQYLEQEDEECFDMEMGQLEQTHTIQ